MMVTVCARHSVNSIREDEVSVPDVTRPELVTVTDVVPPSVHGTVMVRDRPSGETVIAVFIAARLTAAATMLWVVEGPGPEGIGDGADGPWPPQPTRRPRTMRNAPEGHARIGGILPDRRCADCVDQRTRKPTVRLNPVSGVILRHAALDAYIASGTWR